jgi:hypothetical protein
MENHLNRSGEFLIKKAEALDPSMRWPSQSRPLPLSFLEVMIAWHDWRKFE